MQTVGPTARMNLLSGDDGHISCGNYLRLPQNLFHRKKNRLKSTLDSSNESDTISTVNQYRLYLSFGTYILNPNPTINCFIHAADLSLWSMVSISRCAGGATEKRSTW